MLEQHQPEGIAVLELSRGAYKALRRGKILTLDDVIANQDNLLAVRNVGKTIQQEVLAKLAQHFQAKESPVVD